MKSVDSGSSWSVVTTRFAGQFIVAIAFDAQATYVLTYESLFRSTDGGVSWADSRPMPGFVVAAFGGTAALYAMVDGNFCRTFDSAQTWTCSVPRPMSTASSRFPPASPARPRACWALRIGDWS